MAEIEGYKVSPQQKLILKSGLTGAFSQLVFALPLGSFETSSFRAALLRVTRRYDVFRMSYKLLDGGHEYIQFPEEEVRLEFSERRKVLPPVSYTHLTLPTICSV